MHKPPLSPTTSIPFTAHLRGSVDLAAFLMLSIIVSRVLLGLSLAHPIRFGQGAALILASVGTFSSSERIHELLPWLFFALLLFIASVFFLQPEAMLPRSGS